MFEIVDQIESSAVIKVIGVGGGGGNAVHYMLNHAVEGVSLSWRIPIPKRCGQYRRTGRYS